MSWNSFGFTNGYLEEVLRLASRGTGTTMSSGGNYRCELSVRRARYVPEGRTLHLLDFENLCRGPERISSVADAIASEYRELVDVSSADHVVIGVNPANAISSSHVFPGCRFVTGHGPDGADLALLGVVNDIRWVARRFDRVVIGSGDHCFVPLATDLGNLGVVVMVVAWERCLSRELERAAKLRAVFGTAPDTAERFVQNPPIDDGAG